MTQFNILVFPARYSVYYLGLSDLSLNALTWFFQPAYLGFSDLPLGLRQEEYIEDVPDLFPGCQSIISLLEKTAILRQEDVYCYMNRESLKLKPNITIWKTKSVFLFKSFGAVMEMNYRPLF